jgi:hypothetical protein
MRKNQEKRGNKKNGEKEIKIGLINIIENDYYIENMKFHTMNG